MINHDRKEGFGRSVLLGQLVKGMNYLFEIKISAQKVETFSLSYKRLILMESIEN